MSILESEPELFLGALSISTPSIRVRLFFFLLGRVGVSVAEHAVGSPEYGIVKDD
jgi:hypothetical protein